MQKNLNILLIKKKEDILGYTTDFSGEFNLSRPLTEVEKEYINRFSTTRRMKRKVNELMKLYKGKYGYPLFFTVTDEAKKLKSLGYNVELTMGEDKRTAEEIYGTEGEFFCKDDGDCGQTADTSIIDYNNQAITQPGLWCQWVIGDDNDTLEWDGGEKFYCYAEWLRYIIDNFLSKWGVVVNGDVKWYGEDSEDIGMLSVVENVLTVKPAQILF